MKTVSGKLKAVDKCAISQENLLLYGTVVKNTREVYAVCVYSGPDTKMALNSKLSNNKFSTIERSVNLYLLYFVGLLLFEMTISTIFSLVFGIEFMDKGHLEIGYEGWTDLMYHWYLGVYYARNFATGLGAILNDVCTHLGMSYCTGTWVVRIADEGNDELERCDTGKGRETKKICQLCRCHLSMTP